MLDPIQRIEQWVHHENCLGTNMIDAEVDYLEYWQMELEDCFLLLGGMSIVEDLPPMNALPL